MGELDEALLRRAEAAIDAAERVRARSELIVGASESLRNAGMTTRCAWCGRYLFGERWVLVTDAPTFVESGAVSHGICEDCMVELRAAGLSA
jgi:hypothetical protein